MNVCAHMTVLDKIGINQKLFRFLQSRSRCENGNFQCVQTADIVDLDN